MATDAALPRLAERGIALMGKLTLLLFPVCQCTRLALPQAFAIGAFFVLNLWGLQVQVARAQGAIYMPAISPDGQRLAIAKWRVDTGWQLFEGPVQQDFRKMRLPPGQRASGSILYSADGDRVLFTTIPERSRGNREVEHSDQDYAGPTTLWQRKIDDVADSMPQKIFERDLPFGNVLSLKDGSIVFMGRFEKIRSQSASPLMGSERVWFTYKWMMHKSEGTTSVINSRDYAFFSIASLIRDEAVVLVQTTYVNGRRSSPTRYHLDSTELRQGTDVSPLKRLVDMQDGRGGPRLQCDWGGVTCARLIAFDKDGYFAHQLELIRDGKYCKVARLPDRIEQMAISRAGNAMALITQPKPRISSGGNLVYLTITLDGCAGERSVFNLP